MTDLRFGVSLAGWPDGPALLAAARTAEPNRAEARCGQRLRGAPLSFTGAETAMVRPSGVLARPQGPALARVAAATRA